MFLRDASCERLPIPQQMFLYLCTKALLGVLDGIFLKHMKLGRISVDGAWERSWRGEHGGGFGQNRVCVCEIL